MSDSEKLANIRALCETVLDGWREGGEATGIDHSDEMAVAVLRIIGHNGG